MKKKIIFSVLFLLLSFQLCYSQGWNAQSSGSTQRFNDIFFVNENTGYAAGGDSWKQQVFKTTDAGTNWFIVRDFSSYPIFSLYFTDVNNGIAVGGRGVIIRTTDGGSSWTSPISWGDNLNTVFFLNSNIGWIGGNTQGGFASILKTTNGGANWTVVSNDLRGDLYSLKFTDENTGWGTLGSAGKIYRTTNGGTNWTVQTSDSIYQKMYDIDMISPTTGWAVGSEGLILKTSDGGTSWTVQPSGTPDNLRSVRFISPNTGWISGDDAIILVTTDGGANWSFQNTGLGTDIYLYSVFFINENIGWAAGEDGKIIYTTTGGSVSVTLTGTSTPEGFRIYNNYPNPFNPVTKIKFDLPHVSRVKMTVYNSAGQEVAEILNSRLTAGTFEAVFDASNLSSGVYYCQIEAGDFKDVVKMMLVK